MIARARAAVARLPRFETAIFGIAALALVAFGVWRGDRTPRVRFDSYSTFDSASGGYRAFAELLEREGVRVTRFRGRPSMLDAARATLVWAEPLPFDPAQGATTAADVAALEAWVRHGGRLLYLGLDDRAAAQGVLHLPRTRPRARRRAHPGVAEALAAAGVANVFAIAPRRYAPSAHARTLLDDGYGPLVVRYAFGRGEVVAAIDETLFTNADIGAYDRARLAFALAVPNGAGAAVTFDESVHGYAVPSHWWSVVPRTFVIALTLAGIALLVAFAGAAIRLGPPLPSPVRETGTTADFIGALASLLQRGRAAAPTLAELTASTSRAVARTLGLRDGASNEQVAAAIAGDDLRAAYRELVAGTSGVPVDEAMLVRGAALARRIRKDIVPHGHE